MDKKKSLLDEAIADANALHAVALENAEEMLKENFASELQSFIDKTLQMESESIEEEEDIEEMADTSGIGSGDNKQPAPKSSSAATDDPGKHQLGNEDDQKIVKEDEKVTEGEDVVEDKEVTESEEDVTEAEEVSEDSELDEDVSKIVAALSEIEEESGTEVNEMEGMDSDEEEETDMDYSDEEDESGEIDIEEILDEFLASLEGGNDVSEEDEVNVTYESENKELKTELKKAYTTVAEMKEKLQEMLVLNSKLLYANKIFRNFELTENQKNKVIENFDRATNVREAQIVFATIAESFQISTKRRKLSESSASRVMGSTKSAEIISENNAHGAGGSTIINDSFVARMQKLANIKPKG